jgi:two-component system sensor histidine kinase/response regulator
LVLIADRDDEATLICDILTAAGYQVVWMLEGTTAVEQVALLKPQAVLVDRRLNGMDGSEVIASLRQARATASIKILAIADPETLDKPEYGSMSGANDIVEKPIRPDLLLNKITELTLSGCLPQPLSFLIGRISL